MAVAQETKAKAKVVIISSLEEALNRFKEAYKSVESGRSVEPTDTVGFQSLSDLNKALTPERLKLISVIRESKPNSVKELASIVGRDMRNVYRDLKLLEGMGFVKLQKKGKEVKPVVDYDEIVIKL